MRGERSRQTGTSLIEVLIGMVVAALGLMGMARLESLAINQTMNANAQSYAALATENLSAVMKANRAFWSSSALASPFDIRIDQNNATIIRGTGAGSLSTATKSCQTASDCDPAEVAAFDLRRLAVEMAGFASGGRMEIKRVGTALPPIFQVTVSWNEKAMSLGGNSTKYGAGVSSGRYRILVRP